MYESVITPTCDFPTKSLAFFGKTKRKAGLINVIIYLHVYDYIDVYVELLMKIRREESLS